MNRMVKMSLLLVVLFGVITNIGFAAEMKKVLFLRSGLMISLGEHMLDGLKQQGFEQQKNITTEEIIVAPENDPGELIKRIQESAPDVILATVQFGKFWEALKGLSIPIITVNNVESFVDPQGTPVANITGIYSRLQDMEYNSYKFLQKIAPLQKGQAVVFLNNPEFVATSKASVLDALARLHIPVKAVVDVALYEDWQAAVLQYSDDPEVGWILRSSPTKKRDGSAVNMAGEVYPWQREHLKKPTVTYWEEPVLMGTLCAFGIDMNAVGIQTGRMAGRVLQGQPVNTIKAEYPEKVNIALNRKTATNLGIVLPMDVLEVANVIFDDYEGKQVIRRK